MAKKSEFRPDLNIFDVSRTDPGWIYLVTHGELLKVGKTKDPDRRLGREAKTWLPDLKILGVKPFWNISFVERSLHVSLVRYWYDREWYKIDDKNDYELIVGDFLDFYDEDKDMNSVNFIYWMNVTGMADFCHELHNQRLTLPKFRKQESDVRKLRDSEIK